MDNTLLGTSFMKNALLFGKLTPIFIIMLAPSVRIIGSEMLEIH